MTELEEAQSKLNWLLIDLDGLCAWRADAAEAWDRTGSNKCWLEYGRAERAIDQCRRELSAARDEVRRLSK